MNNSIQELLLDWLAANHREQMGEETYYSRRLPKNSPINPDKLISGLFSLLRVADSERYPIFFNKFNHTYKISLEKYTI